MGEGRIEPDFGSRLLPQVVDQLAISDPNRTYAVFATDSDLGLGFQHVSMQELAHAVNRTAWWIENTLGKSTTFETVAYIGPSDIRYAIILLAVIKCGYKLFVPSPRNAVWVNKSLLQSTACSKCLCATAFVSLAKTLRDSAHGLAIHEVESLNEMFDGDRKPYSYDDTYANAKWDPILVLHSSGSTGVPKPIVTNHAAWAVADRDRYMPTVDSRKNQNWALFNFGGDGGKYYAAFPPFHLGGIMAFIVLPIYSTQATVVLGPADRPPNGQIISGIMQNHDLKAIFAPPMIIEQLLQRPGGPEMAAHLDFLLCAGGPLTQSTGESLSQVTSVCQFYGSTETNGIPALVPQRGDWEYFEFHPAYGVDFISSDDNAFEMVLRRGSRARDERTVSCNYPDIEEYHTKDLFVPHPTRGDLWKFHGRRDDIIVLSNGYKFNPVPLENAIIRHPLLSAALVVGFRRPQPVLLVEPSLDVELKVEDFIKGIWPTVEEANAQAPAYGRIMRSMILAVPANKRFERAGKGTVIRKMTADKFANEIESLYEEQVHGNQRLGNVVARHFDEMETKSIVSASVRSSMSLPDLKDEDDLYVRGLDSLGTIEILALIQQELALSFRPPWLDARSLYANPSIEKLTTLIHHSMQPEMQRSPDYRKSGEPRVAEMASLLSHFTKDMCPKLRILLTGSTGSLGKHLLRTFLDDPRVGRIICLNRSSSPGQQYPKTYDQESHLRITVHITDYTSNHLGLNDDAYSSLLGNTDIVIHAAWPVNFNYALESFAPQLQGVRNMIDFSLESKNKPRIVFISSTSSVASYTLAGDGVVPESLVTNHDVPDKMGYAESKHVAECMLGIAAQHCQVPVSIIRIGQMAGPVSSAGEWSSKEWVHAMVKTSQTIGALPADLPDVDWVPVDDAAAIVRDLTLNTPAHDISLSNDNTKSLRVFNVLNPRPTAWINLLPDISRCLGTDIDHVSLERWMETIERKYEEGLAKNTESQVLSAMPAVSILSFFRRLVRNGDHSVLIPCSTEKAGAQSETLRNLSSISGQMMERWMRSWGFSSQTLENGRIAY